MIEPTDEMIEAIQELKPLDGTDAEAIARAVLAIVEREQVAPLRELLAQLVDEDPCWLDHHGYCQAHSLHSPPCPHRVAKELLGWSAS